MQTERDKTGLALAGATLAAVTASLCCILPIVAAVLGIAGLAAAEVFERWRPHLLDITFGLLALGFYLAYRPGRKEVCDTGSRCVRKPVGRWNRAMLWSIAVLVVVLAAFPYYGGWAVSAVGKHNQPARPLAKTAAAHVKLKLEGMDCPACAAELQNTLQQTAGVLRAEVSYQDKQASIDYDPARIDPPRLVQAVTNAGFKAVLSPPGSN